MWIHLIMGDPFDNKESSDNGNLSDGEDASNNGFPLLDDKDTYSKGECI
jgi:hypothetical protein